MNSVQSLNILNTGMEKISAANAELLAIREGQALTQKNDGQIKQVLKCSREKMIEKSSALGGLLEREGCVSIPNILSSSTCDELLAYVNKENEDAKRDVTAGSVPFDSRFGGVNCRGLNGQFGVRQDMFLPSSSEIVSKSLSEAITNLLPLFKETITEEGTVHEISSFVADPGSPRQCVHADTIVLPCPQYPNAFMEPIYTIFLALQDVQDDMGHTQFFPKTHTKDVHLLWNSKAVQGDTPRFVSVNPVVQSALKKGDAAIFDSRLLHCGMANTSKLRRVIFYFSVSKQKLWPLPDGLHGSNSIRSEDRYRYQIKDFLSK